ncbi:VanW family protein [Candidatus Daviesbacteria bacterium]|nr:VanW family protein [Candidatus Daviesbacteria bacterium]
MRKRVQNLAKKFALPVILFIVLIVLIILTFEVIFQDKFFPFTYVGDTNITFLTSAQAQRVVSAKFSQRVNEKLQFEEFTIDLATASAKLDYTALYEAFQTGHREQLKTLFFNHEVYPQVYFNIEGQLQKIAQATYQQPRDARLIFNEITTPEGSASARIEIEDSSDGLELDQEEFKDRIAEYLLFGQTIFELPVKAIPPKVTTNHAVRAKQALETLKSEPIKLVFEENTWILDIKQLLTLLGLEKGGDLLLDKDKTYIYLKRIVSEIDQAVQEGLFEFNPQTKRVAAFRPSQEGRKLDLEKSYQQISAALTDQGSKIISLPVAVVKPKIYTQDVNSLGIKELLGRGLSHFAGSIPNRIYNINLTAQKINGVLVAPGEVFSFNQTVGDITEATGFRKAYVIKEGRTVLDDGGGVCQDSTTLFRAVLNAGLPVVKRTAHAYRVGYYEQGFPPGLDATVFYPSVDFQFKNDTPAHILIQAYTTGTTLYVDLYGTPDGRISTISKSVVANQTPPPPELRQDDPTLPKGEVRQVDWAAWGADVSFQRTVTRGGETIIKETWKSSYRPWQAVYLVGTKE